MRLAIGSALVLLAAAAAARVPDRGLLENRPIETLTGDNGTCVSCHTSTDSPTMHDTQTVNVSCPQCHGGNAKVEIPDACGACWPGREGCVRLGADDAGTDRCDEETRRRCDEAKRTAHVVPLHPERWPSSANTVRSYSALNAESYDFIRFINPGDLRVAADTCGAIGCHRSEVNRVQLSMMTHGAMLWGAALYNNGSYPLKNPRFGDAYGCDRDEYQRDEDRNEHERDENGSTSTDCRWTPQRLQTLAPPTDDETKRLGILPFLDPLPRFEIAQMGNILRVFERGDDRLSPRGLGTLNRTDPVFQGLQRTRLLDPTLSFLGTNDGPGDYRSSGCTACHVVYANDNDGYHSGRYARYGHDGTTSTCDPTIPSDERGHPIAHRFTRRIPSSQCVVCHMHPGTSFANTYFGYTWWDNETHGTHMYPQHERHPTPDQEFLASSRNPEGSALRGLWGDLYPEERNQAGELAGKDFLERTSSLNDKLSLTKFADFHGHGWMFRAVFKHDRKGRLLDAKDGVVPEATPENTSAAVDGTHLGEAGVPVHLKDIHLEKGMHCVDCHFEQDVHGNGKLYGEVRNAIEIECVDCHGSTRGRATLRTSGPAAPPGGTDLAPKRTPFGDPVFEWRGGTLVQHSMLDSDRSWEVVQVLDSITPGNRHYNVLSRLAKTIRRDGTTWGDVPADAPDVRAGGEDPPVRWGTRAAVPDSTAALAHRDDDMACYTCHTSWMTSCFGCHLPMRANQRRPLLHYEGDFERNWTQYNYQVLRDDVFMLGRDGTVKRNRIAPVRSSSAVIVGSQNLNREWIYSQQQTVSAQGFAGQAFNPHFPHAVRAAETKTCTDCHLSKAGDNNAWMAQVLLQGTGFTNFLGRYVWVGEEDDGFEAVVVTEQDEPQAVIGSRLHEIAYPDRFRAHLARNRVLDGSSMFEHPGNDVLAPWVHNRVQSLQLRGEYLYSANGPGGLRVYDVADIDNKKIAERITTSVISPLGQDTHFSTTDAAAVVAPATLAVDPGRNPVGENEERGAHKLYAYLYVLDRVEGLILTNAFTLLNGDPNDNFLKREPLAGGGDRFDPDGALDGVSNGTIAGHYLYVVTPRGLRIIDIDEPTAPVLIPTEVPLRDARAVAVQLRYAFVAYADGLATVDVTDPRDPKLVAHVPIADARDVYLARTYAYVAGGSEGLVVVDIERPEHPFVDQVYDAGGAINDTRAVKVGMTNASLFAYLADGKNGLRVVQLMSPDTPGYTGFSPRPRPDLPGHGLIATYPTHGPAVTISRGLDRDRAVDESGNQVAVFGRRGAGPLDPDADHVLKSAGGTLLTVHDVRTPADVRRWFSTKP